MNRHFLHFKIREFLIAQLDSITDTMDSWFSRESNSQKAQKVIARIEAKQRRLDRDEAKRREREKSAAEKILKMGATPPTAEPSTVMTNVQQGAIIGGWACFGLGILFMLWSLLLFFLYVPFFLVAFVLSIIAMSQRRIVGGISLLMATLLVPTILGVVLFAIRTKKIVDDMTKDSNRPSVVESRTVTHSTATSDANLGSIPNSEPAEPSHESDPGE